MPHTFTIKQQKSIVNLHQNGVPVVRIAKKYKTTVWVIYYQLRQNCGQYIEHPQCYNDYVHNQILHLESELKKNRNKRIDILLKAEIKNCKRSLHIKKSNMGISYSEPEL